MYSFHRPGLLSYHLTMISSSAMFLRRHYSSKTRSVSESNAFLLEAFTKIIKTEAGGSVKKAGFPNFRMNALVPARQFDAFVSRNKAPNTTSNIGKIFLPGDVLFYFILLPWEHFTLKLDFSCTYRMI